MSRERGGDKNEKLDNGYPFRDDIITFTIRYKKKEFYFEFPVLMDKSFLLREIKKRTGVRGTFTLQWQEFDKKNIEQQKLKVKQSEKPERLADLYKENRGEDICIHSSYLTTLALTRFCGHTLTMISGDASKIFLSFIFSGIFNYIFFFQLISLSYNKQKTQSKSKGSW